jgi:hypothetical protein
LGPSFPALSASRGQKTYPVKQKAFQTAADQTSPTDLSLSDQFNLTKPFKVSQPEPLPKIGDGRPLRRYIKSARADGGATAELQHVLGHCFSRQFGP